MNINNIESKILDLLIQKRDNIKKILQLSKDVIFIGEESDIDKFSALIKEREAIFSKVKELDNEIESLDFKKIYASGSTAFVKSVDDIKIDIKSIARQIIKLDEKMNENASKVMSLVKENLKGIKNGKNLRELYQTDIGIGSASFDMRK